MLCYEEKQLIKRSHLIPNFMYKGIEDDKNRLYKISTLNLTHFKIVQSGDYEEYILCHDCDNKRLSKLERYANNYLYSREYRTNNKVFEKANNHGICSILCKNIDYDIFKLFLQSILWRASISNNPMFKDFKLKGEQEEQLRISILKNVPLDESDYACTIATHHDIEYVDTNLVYIVPEIKRKVIFFINQFIYMFYLDINDVNLNEKELHLNRNNEMGILILPYGEWSKIINSLTKAFVDFSK